MKSHLCSKRLLFAFLSIAAAARAQTPDQPPMGPTSTIAGTRTSGLADTLYLGGESDHIFPGIQGGSGTLDWVHSPNSQWSLVGGFSSDVLGTSSWTYGHAGVVYFHPRWTVETSFKAGKGSTGPDPFKYQDYYGIFTYQLSQHFYPVVKEEYISIGASYGNLVKAGICACGFHRFSTTISGAHSTSGNLATEYISLREETAKGKFEPYMEVTAGKILPRLVNPALTLYTSSYSTYSVTGGSRVITSHRTSFSLAASYITSGPTSTLSFAVSTAIKIRGE
jgi:hypothetical protein